MQAQFVQLNDEDHFANACYSKNIECILPMAEMFINFKTNTRNGLQTRKLCFLCAEKMDFKGLIQIRITEKCDQRRMYITTIDSASFPELKQDQSLHVTFSGFIENLLRLLNDCQAGKLQIHVVQLSSKQNTNFSSNLSCNDGIFNNTEYQLQFLEVRPFKNLVHLCLPCRLAPVDVVLFYMNSIVDAMQKKLSSHELSTEQLQHELLVQQRRNEQLDAENIRIRETLQESNNSLSRKHAEDIQQLQENIRKLTEQHHNEKERHRKSLSTLQEQIDKLSREKVTQQVENCQELKRYETLSDDLANANSQLAKMKTQNEHLQAEFSTLKNQERKTEMHLGDARKHINELQEKLKKHDKQKADIIAELEAEKKISQTKRQALEVATEEISKANEIIYKQAQELLRLKKTVSWRTEIALEQEKAITEKEKELSLCEEELKQTKVVVNTLRDEVPQQLDSLRTFANSLEVKYTQEINALRESLKSCKENNYTGKSTTSRRK